ncbi:MAG: hypothetical protein K2N70_01370, partial [Helicobacter sp.]|nr:hypothetical protein [Helicobacter sp.]
CYGLLQCREAGIYFHIFPLCLESCNTTSKNCALLARQILCPFCAHLCYNGESFAVRWGL